MADEGPRGPADRFFRACALVLGGVVCIIVALTLIEHIWGWLLLAAAIAFAWWLAVSLYRYWWGRR